MSQAYEDQFIERAEKAPVVVTAQRVPVQSVLIGRTTLAALVEFAETLRDGGQDGRLTPLAVAEREELVGVIAVGRATLNG